MAKIKRALISVSDKTGLEEFVRELDKLGVEMLSTGGTAKLIKSLNINVRLVSDYTGFKEILNGRVKTLHPKIHAALLARREDKVHMQQVEELRIELIDLVVVNLYPFEQTIKKPNVTLEEAVENIDIGGPAMLRSAAKNYQSVAVICNPVRYQEIIKELKGNDCSLSAKTKFFLAREVFEHTSTYDQAISRYLSSISGEQQKGIFPPSFNISLSKVQELRYGENAHQKAAFYKQAAVGEPCLATATQLHGRELSFNNILDLNAALEIVKDFDLPTVSIIKHNNPCGAASAAALAQAFSDALECDRLSAFGSIVAFNRAVDTETAREVMLAEFIECVIAPGYEEKALILLKQKKNLRILELPRLTANRDESELDIKKVVGGMLVQSRDLKTIMINDLKYVSKRSPTEEQLQSMMFAWKICKHVKSNAIVLAQGRRTVGIGAGQMSRIDAVIIAVRKAGINAKNSVLASDAFFPKADGVETAIKAGVSCIIQPGGSVRDDEVVRVVNAAGICMVFTSTRHFRH
ncbi:MAG: bifunctional phosphoribosylaminoimidazolecarboxamide formyltransferase/IMP cyclohydrolase [Candidatus Omnitrophota bacterium]